MSETPHTDAREVCPFSIPRNKLAVPSDFARRLERELAAERESFRLHREKVRDEEEKLHVQIMELKCHLVAERADKIKWAKALLVSMESLADDNPDHWASDESRRHYAELTIAAVREEIKQLEQQGEAAP